jgi:predicted DNA-binding protein with PD1-like motif
MRLSSTFSRLLDFAERYHITSAHFTAIGVYKKIPINGQHEVIGMSGDIALYHGKPVVHTLMVVGKSDGTTQGGHVLDAYVSPTLEVMVTVNATAMPRRLDPETDLALIDPSLKRRKTFEYMRRSGLKSSVVNHRLAIRHYVFMKLTRSLGITALAFSALAQSQVKKNEAETLTVTRTARIIQVLPEISQLNESVRNQSDALRITELRQVIIEKVLAASLQVDATIAQMTTKSLKPMRSVVIFPINGTELSTVPIC